jgi:hypothetical protein
MLNDLRDNFLGRMIGFGVLRGSWPGEPVRVEESRLLNGGRGRVADCTGLILGRSCTGDDSKICSRDNVVGLAAYVPKRKEGSWLS